ncbi:MAG: ankyrin repeat domain-containing protein [Campylobacterales bacterium]|nr:ankyrin repeat domain-containing protein [Campylobacterales bacterium]
MNEIAQAIVNDSVVKMRSLLQNGASATKSILIGEEYDLEEYDEISPLFYAIRKYASIDMIELLLEHGADILSVDSDGISALDVAIKFKRKDVAKFCIDQGIDLNQTKRKSGILPLMLASCFSDLEMIELLINAGAKLDITDKMGASAKDYAKKLGQKKVVEFLDAKGAKFNLYPEEK